MKLPLLAAVVALFAVPAFAQDIKVTDPYARSAGANAKTGAAFFVIENHSDSDDRLIEARSDAAERVELHTHLEDANGIMRMIEVEDGFAVPAHGTHALMRGGDHVMFMGLNAPFVQGENVTVTLVFENAGEVLVEIPVDLERQDSGMGHGGMNHDHGAGHTNHDG